MQVHCLWMGSFFLSFEGLGPGGIVTIQLERVLDG